MGRLSVLPVTVPPTLPRLPMLPLLRFFLTLIFLSGSVFAADRPATFERDIQPVLTRLGCNAGACHGKARGQNGFALSLLGFDPDWDYNAIVKEARGRRLFPADPASSLFLLKACGDVPHGGGKRLIRGSPQYQLLLAWIATGTPRTPANAPTLSRVEVAPNQLLAKFHQSVPLKVEAIYTDGSREDVTALAAYQSNESAYAAVNPDGLVTVNHLAGEAAITARFRDQFAVCRVLIPRPGTVPTAVYDRLPRVNPIDGPVWDKLRQLGLTPSPPASEVVFHRRAFLSIIGRRPLPDETRAYLADPDPDRRVKLIDRLLDRPEYVDFWANKWADLLRPNPYHVGIKATLNFDAWIRDQFRRNVPYDQFVRDLLTAQGSTFRHGATVYYRNRRDPAELATMTSQLFLGVRLDCAKCHQHPSERWSQRDFYQFAAFFSRVGYQGTGISAPISGGEEVIFVKPTGSVTHPLTGEVLAPVPLLAPARDIPPDQDPRRVLTDWMLQPDNPFFARVLVNRVWADLMGRGLVDPVDDFRDTNPATNPAVLDVLAQSFRSNGYDLKKLIRLIATSQVFALSAEPNETNLSDTRNYSRRYRQRLRAEVLLDALSDVTGVPEKFDAMPPGARALESWTVRFDSKFLDSFGRPDPNQDPPCERTSDTTVVQALHLMNSPNLQRKITAETGRAAQLAGSNKTPAQIVEELYLRAYSRPPTAAETAACVARFEKPGATRREVVENLMWALVNTPEFLFGD